MQAISRVILKGERYNNKVKIGKEIEIEIDPDFQPEEYANLEFEVVSAPRGAELEKGETVFTMWWVAMHNPADDSYLSNRFSGHYHAEYNDIVGVKRNGEIQGYGEYIFVEPIKRTATSQSKDLVLDFKTYLEPNLSTVRFANPDTPYKEKGVTIINNKYTPWRLRFNGIETYAAKRDGIVGVYDKGNFLPSENIIILQPLDQDIELKMINGLLLSRIDLKRFVTKDGKEFTRAVPRSDDRGVVIAKGSNIRQCEEGEIVVYHRRPDNLLLIDGKKYYYCFEEDLFVGIIED